MREEWFPKRGKTKQKKKRQNLGLGDGRRQDIAMEVTCLTSLGLLPGTGRERNFFSKSKRVETAHSQEKFTGCCEPLAGVRVEGGFSTGCYNRAGAVVHSFGRISSVSGPHLRISRRSPVLF